MSFPSQPVRISTLHVVGDVVGRCIAVATNERSTITLPTEALENTVDFRPSSHYVILHPGNFCIVMTVTDSNLTGVCLAFFGAGVGGCAFNVAVVVGVIVVWVSILGFTVARFICVGLVAV
jgi:hypothetical protein